MHVCMCACVHTHLPSHPSLVEYVYVYACIHTYTHAHMHGVMHVHIDVYTSPPPAPVAHGAPPRRAPHTAPNWAGDHPANALPIPGRPTHPPTIPRRPHTLAPSLPNRPDTRRAPSSRSKQRASVTRRCASDVGGVMGGVGARDARAGREGEGGSAGV